MSRGRLISVSPSITHVTASRLRPTGVVPARAAGRRGGLRGRARRRVHHRAHEAPRARAAASRAAASRAAASRTGSRSSASVRAARFGPAKRHTSAGRGASAGFRGRPRRRAPVAPSATSPCHARRRRRQRPHERALLRREQLAEAHGASGASASPRHRGAARARMRFSTAMSAGRAPAADDDDDGALVIRLGEPHLDPQDGITPAERRRRRSHRRRHCRRRRRHSVARRCLVTSNPGGGSESAYVPMSSMRTPHATSPCRGPRQAFRARAAARAAARSRRAR